jgi:hypothetical protein
MTKDAVDRSRQMPKTFRSGDGRGWVNIETIITRERERKKKMEYLW